MKFLTIILSLYFSVLTAKPCVDGASESLTTHSELTHAEENHEHSLDLCSPFCSCACCGVQILHQEAVSFFSQRKPADLFEHTTSFYQSRLQSDYFGSIWQPPQLYSINN